jgi:hypothetical protein
VLNEMSVSSSLADKSPNGCKAQNAMAARRLRSLEWIR